MTMFEWPYRVEPSGAVVNRPSTNSQTFPDVREFGSYGNNFLADNREGETIQKAINELTAGGRGTTLMVPSGDASILAPINMKALTGMTIAGAGGLSGGGGIGRGGATPPSRWIYRGGAAPRAIDLREAFGCTFRDIAVTPINEAFNGYIFDCESSAFLEFARGKSECLKGAVNIVPASHFNLTNATINKWSYWLHSGGESQTVGRTVAAKESVLHYFDHCFWVAAFNNAVLNPDAAWQFNNCTWEGLFNNKGVETGVGSIAFTNAEFVARSLLLSECYSASNNAAKRVGNNIEFRGNGLVVEGGFYATSETLFWFPGGTANTHIHGPRFRKATNGIVAAAATNLTNCRMNWDAEEVTEPFLNAGTNIGCEIQGLGGAATAAATIAEPGAFVTGAFGLSSEAAMKALVEEVQKIAKTLKSVGAAK